MIFDEKLTKFDLFCLHFINIHREITCLGNL